MPFDNDYNRNVSNRLNQIYFDHIRLEDQINDNYHQPANNDITGQYEHTATLAENSGHWTAILKYNDIIETFDPYGLKYDNELDWISNNAKAKLHEDVPLLSQLLNKTNHKVIYNKTRFQSMSKDISTCGDHCVSRIYRLTYNDFDLDEYTSYMKHIKDEYDLTYDEIVSEFVSSFIQNIIIFQ